MELRLIKEGRRPTDYELIWSAICGAVLGGVFVWAKFAGEELLPKCSFHQLTGLPCLTCGATRALLSLFALNPIEALKFNPLCALVWFCALLFVPYGAAASYGLIPRVRFRLSERDWFMCRFLIPAAGIANWLWLFADGR